MPRLILPIYVFLCLGCSQGYERLSQEVQRLRLAFSLVRYQQDIKQASTIEEVTSVYEKGERLALSLKHHLTPALMPIYSENLAQTYQTIEQAQQELNKCTQAVGQTAKILIPKKQAYEQADQLLDQAQEPFLHIWKDERGRKHIASKKRPPPRTLEERKKREEEQKGTRLRQRWLVRRKENIVAQKKTTYKLRRQKRPLKRNIYEVCFMLGLG